MNSILDAVLAAQARNKEEDRLRLLRQQEAAPVLPVAAKPILPVPQGDDGGDGPPVVQDTRTYEEKYQDLVNANRNQGLEVVLPGGMFFGLARDYQINKMEEMYPELKPRDPYTDYARSRFSNVGQVMLGRGYPTQQGRTVETIWDRITGRTPTWTESLARTNYPVPTNTRNYNLGGDGGGDGPYGSQPGSNNTYNFGGRESMVSDYDDYSGYA